MSGQDHLPARLWWLLAALTMAWGLNWTAMKLALAEVPPKPEQMERILADNRGRALQQT